MLDAAKAVRLFKNSVEHRGEIAGRRIDVLKHLCQGRLAGQCFVALRGPRLELLPKCRYRLPEINVRIVGHRLLAPDDTLVPPALPASTRLALVDRRSKCSRFLPHPAARGEVGIRALHGYRVRGKRPAHNSPSPRPFPRKRGEGELRFTLRACERIANRLERHRAISVSRSLPMGSEATRRAGSACAYSRRDQMMAS